MKHINLILNPKRIKIFTRAPLKSFIIKLFCKLGFLHIDYGLVHGDGKLTLGKNVSTMNTIMNTSSGNIIIGDNSIFGHNCMVLTGTHRFYNGCRASLSDIPYNVFPETPLSGRDITIGDGCFIGSGSILIGPISIGRNSIICAGAVVTKSFDELSIIAGLPAKKIGSTKDSSS